MFIEKSHSRTRGSPRTMASTMCTHRLTLPSRKCTNERKERRRMRNFVLFYSKKVRCMCRQNSIFLSALVVILVVASRSMASESWLFLLFLRIFFTLSSAYDRNEQCTARFEISFPHFFFKHLSRLFSLVLA